MSERLNQTGNILAKINSASEEINEAALIKAGNELQLLESDLMKLITDTSVIRRLVEEEENTEHSAKSALKDFFDSIPQMFQEIKKYTRQIEQIQQKQGFIEQEKIRVSNLLIRKEEEVPHLF